ncbi:MAG TPA: hypothetical protein PKN80_07685, partial [bacterium]|nr:hypothetical protein [bacterium]
MARGFWRRSVFCRSILHPLALSLTLPLFLIPAPGHCQPPYFESGIAFIDHAFFRKADSLDPGTVHLFIKNTGATPLSVEKIILNGTELTGMPDDQILWYQAVPPVSRPGEVIDCMVKLRRPTRKPIRIEARLSNRERVSAVIHPSPPRLKFNFIGFSRNYEAVYLYLENTGKEDLSIEKIFCNARDITPQCFIPNKTFRPSSKGLVIYTPPGPLLQGKYLTFKAIAGGEETAEAQIRVYSHFPITTFGREDTRSEFGFDPAGFEMKYPASEANRNQPPFKAYHLIDDPACADGKAYQIIGTAAGEIVKRAGECWTVDPIHPNLIYSCEHYKPDSYFIYAETTDIMVIDPYAMYFNRNQPQRDAYFTSIAKRASEPRLLWTIPQAFTAGEKRFPTPEEERIIVWSEVGEGSKGIWYYRYNPRGGYPASPPLEEEIGRINRELQLVRDYILISEPFPLAAAEA